MDGSIAIDRLESSGRIDVTIAQDEIEHELEQLHQESFGWALACCGRNPDEAEDVLQMTYLKILDGTARFEGRSSFQTWLFGIIRRTALQRRRKFAVRERLLRLLFMRQTTSFAPGPDASIEYSIRSKRLIQALHALSGRQCAVLQLVFYHEMTVEQAAAVLGISSGSARTHYARGKKNLAGRLREHDYD